MNEKQLLKWLHDQEETINCVFGMLGIDVTLERDHASLSDIMKLSASEQHLAIDTQMKRIATLLQTGADINRLRGGENELRNKGDPKSKSFSADEKAKKSQLPRSRE